MRPPYIRGSGRRDEGGCSIFVFAGRVPALPASSGTSASAHGAATRLCRAAIDGDVTLGRLWRLDVDAELARVDDCGSVAQSNSRRPPLIRKPGRSWLSASYLIRQPAPSSSHYKALKPSSGSARTQTSCTGSSPELGPSSSVELALGLRPGVKAWSAAANTSSHHPGGRKSAPGRAEEVRQPRLEAQ
jgi:hypothetical protein